MKKIETILLIDDDKDDQEIFIAALHKVDGSITCYTADDGEDGLKRMDDMLFTPDLIFLDLNMPRMDGRQVLIEMDKRGYLKKIPVIIYTTSSHQKDVDETKKLGAVGFLTKPNSLTELYEALSRVILAELAR